MFTKQNIIYLKSIYTNNTLKKIVNIYQQKYVNMFGQGFGDFLRGSIYLIYICFILNLDFDIDIKNHPMSKYLYNNIKVYDIFYSNIIAESKYFDNIDEAMSFTTSFIKKLNNYDEEIFYTFNNCNILNIKDIPLNIIETAQKIIKPKIEPSQIILEKLDDKLSKIGLKRNMYAVIHIRSGDYFMNLDKKDNIKHQISLNHINQIHHNIKKYCNKQKKYIVIGDSNYIKKSISDRYDNLYFFDSNITHLGESINPSDKSIMETLIDFNIMRYSNFIISFTAYGHGSGFSNYCSFIYNINFHQSILTPTLEYEN